jgi:hypothetical protein
MNTFSLQMSLVDQGADITPMMKAWMDLSDGKGWPKNEEGWRRYQSRLVESGGFPKVRSVASGRSGDSSSPPPDEFVAWWSQHSESIEGPAARVAWSCLRYRAEWDALKLLAA